MAEEDRTFKTGFLDTLTEQQAESLAKLKELVNESEYAEAINARPEGDKYLLKYLRATMKDKKKKRIFYVPAAYTRLISTWQWKLDNNVKERGEKQDLLQEVYPRYYYKDYKAKTVVWIQRQGEFGTNVKGTHLKKEEWYQCVGHNLMNMEFDLHELSEECGEEVTGYISIADMKGLGLGMMNPTRVGILKMLAGIAAENYPETVDKIIIVNAPWVFSRLYEFAKGFLDADTVSKFTISNKPLTELFPDVFDLDLLPKEYGGNNDIVVPHPLDARRK